MKLKYCLHLIFICSSSVFAQTIVNDTVVYKKILIVPFEKRMYLSDIDKEVTKASEIDFKDLLKKYWIGFHKELRNTLKSKYSVEVLQDNAHTDSVSDLAYTYQSISYSYDKLITEPAKTSSKLIPQFGKKQGSVTENDDRISEGQLIDKKVEGKRFISVQINNPKLIPKLNEKYQPDFFLFIGQMEFKSDLSDYSAVSSKTNKRMIKIHFTIFDKESKKVFSGIAENEFLASVNKIDDIIAENFNNISVKILNTFPGENLIIKQKEKIKK